MLGYETLIQTTFHFTISLDETESKGGKKSWVDKFSFGDGITRRNHCFTLLTTHSLMKSKTWDDNES